MPEDLDSRIGKDIDPITGNFVDYEINKNNRASSSVPINLTDENKVLKESSLLSDQVESIKREITTLENQQIEIKSQADNARSGLWNEWKNKSITSNNEFRELSKKISEREVSIREAIRRKLTEYRIARISYLSHTTAPDALLQRVLDLHVKENIDKYQNGINIQSGGSNAQGVFEIDNGEFVLIKKIKETYEFEGALPYLMQKVDTNRIPRVLEVFETSDATYKIMQKATGVQVDKLSENQILEIPQEHIDQLVADITSLDEAGLQIDPSKKSNFFYDKQKGFIIIDVGDFYYDPRRKDTLKNLKIEDLMAVLSDVKKDQRIFNKIQKAIIKMGGV